MSGSAYKGGSDALSELGFLSVYPLIVLEVPSRYTGNLSKDQERCDDLWQVRVQEQRKAPQIRLSDANQARVSWYEKHTGRKMTREQLLFEGVCGKYMKSTDSDAQCLPQAVCSWGPLFRRRVMQPGCFCSFVLQCIVLPTCPYIAPVLDNYSCQDPGEPCSLTHPFLTVLAVCALSPKFHIPKTFLRGIIQCTKMNCSALQVLFRHCSVGAQFSPCFRAVINGFCCLIVSKMSSNGGGHIIRSHAALVLCINCAGAGSDAIKWFRVQAFFF